MQKIIKKTHKPISALLLVGLIILGIASSVLKTEYASADQINTRSLTLVATGPTTDGGSKPGGTVSHQFAFTLPSVATSSTGSILFQYCTLAAGSCTTPTGLNTTGATLLTSTGAAFTSIVNTTNGLPYISRTAATISPGTAVVAVLGNVINPDATDCPLNNPTPGVSAPSCTFFVRISTFAATNATGSAIDTGSVAASVNGQITLTGTMPESLVFCTGATVSTTAGVPDCATATLGAVTFNQLFSPTDTATATSQMAASTNAGAGYTITVNGPTLTSGLNTVSPMASPALGVRGLSQFGLNLKANTTTTSTPAKGIEVAPAANNANYRGQAVTGYNTVDTFKYATSNIVADSANLTAGGTDAQIFTVTYIVNVPGSQPAGTYTTTLTYICTPTF